MPSSGEPKTVLVSPEEGILYENKHVSRIVLILWFRGVQKIFQHKEPNKSDPTTIQGILEIALQKLKPINDIYVVPSSRTDTGVHAIQTTFHVDLRRRNEKAYNTNGITTLLNKYFNVNKKYVRVLKTSLVPNDFHCRYNAKSRTYLYRLAVIKHDILNQYNNINLCRIPIEEYGRCCFLCSPDFNFENLCATSKLFEGYHDFRTFMGRGSHYLNKKTRRTMQRVNVTKSNACVLWNEDISDSDRTKDEHYEYWNIIFKSEGFLYNQVRRIVGTLIAVGENRVTPEEVQCMLQVPSHLSWNPRVIPAPSHGLYLWQVEYSSDDLRSFK